MLEVRNLAVRHGYLQALSEVSLSVAPGETLAIIGANGAGKSTLLRSIIGLHQPATGRALMANPRVLLLDELSLGLAPTMVRRIYGVLPELVKSGMAILLVEQDVAQALRIADRFQCLLEGRTTLEGKPADATTAKIEAAYFGLAGRAGPGSAA